MQANVKTPTNAIRDKSDSEQLSIPIDKKDSVISGKKILALVMALILGGLLITTYRNGDPQFGPLLNASGILIMIAFIAIKSNNSIKTQRKCQQ